MGTERKTFLKLAAALFVLVLVMSVWEFGRPWKLYIWAAIGIALLLAASGPLARPLHDRWRAFVDATTEGMRFFLGTGIVTGLVALYQALHVSYILTLQWPPQPGAYRWWALASTLALVVGAVRPLAGIIFRAWMGLAHALQAVMSRVILTIVYLVAVVPVGLTAKLVGKRFLEKELDPERESYWIDRPQVDFEQRRYRRHF